ncbi:hypothetical protein Q5752_004568 [Cryptotrichosporon argae]
MSTAPAGDTASFLGSTTARPLSRETATWQFIGETVHALCSQPQIDHFFDQGGVRFPADKATSRAGKVAALADPTRNHDTSSWADREVTTVWKTALHATDADGRDVVLALQTVTASDDVSVELDLKFGKSIGMTLSHAVQTHDWRDGRSRRSSNTNLDVPPAQDWHAVPSDDGTGDIAHVYRVVPARYTLYSHDEKGASGTPVCTVLSIARRPKESEGLEAPDIADVVKAIRASLETETTRPE